ncbi:MAG: DUF1553 domain-containing protein [Planctomycetes bacterium]|nr:DUF1553 domain-containing protein [Planctomycetota bacterium]
MIRYTLHLVFVLGTSSFFASATCLAQQKAPSEQFTFFEKNIRPVLVEHCYRCHSSGAAKGGKVKGGLQLDTREGIRTGGKSGPAIVPGNTAKSLLLAALRHETVKMPPSGKLPDSVVADFASWIERGAPDPRDGKPLTQTEKIDWQKAREFWAFQPPKVHAPPQVRNAMWPRKDIDRFILAELEKRGLEPVRAATKREWIRRATFDLIGLPPTPEETEAFENDKSPEAHAKVVDRLLASPHYGERWGRYWLDLARYTDDLGGTVGPVLAPTAFRYRDWVIQAFNRDMPYDQFVRLQLAGDLIPEPAKDYAERLGGLGFQGLGQRFSGNAVGMVKKKVADELDDRVDTVTRALLGLTVSCARCHDHKFDPIPTVDYYSLATAYNGAKLSDEIALGSPTAKKARDEWQKQAASLSQKIKDAAKNATTPDAKAALESLQAELARLNQSAPPAMVKGPAVSGGGQAMRVNVRGNPDQLGDVAPAGFLQILKSKDALTELKFTRLELADAIVDRHNPLTARVYVNRVWHYHFGRGIVGTTSNFGQLGDRPTHPELLDTLAVRFMDNGWSTKWLHREIMLSAVYGLSSIPDAKNLAKDADNHYLWRVTPRRLDFEAWRDSMLTVAGKLDPQIGGPPYLDSKGKVQLHPEDPSNRRRTIYGFISRFKPNPTLTLFDFPEPNVTSDQRTATTIPQQQLFALNSPFVLAMSRSFAARLEASEKSEERRLLLGWQLAFGRLPTEREVAIAREFLREASSAEEKLGPWERLCHSLLTTNEFAFVP